MKIEIENVLQCGDGHKPQAVHYNNNDLQIIYLDDAGKVYSKEANPSFGQYSEISFVDDGFASDDVGVVNPSIKKIPHYGAIGYWTTTDNVHRFTSNAVRKVIVSWKRPGDGLELYTSFDIMVVI